MKRWKNFLIILAVLVWTVCGTLIAEAGETGTVVMEETPSVSGGDGRSTERLPDITWTGADHLSLPKPSSQHVLSAQGGTDSFNDCFGNQLSGYAREFYEGLVSHYVTSRNTGSFLFTFPYRPTCTYSGTREEYQQTAAFQNMMDELDLAAQAATDAFAYDHPEIFWVGGCLYGPRDLFMESIGSTHTIYAEKFSFELQPLDRYASNLSGYVAAFEAGVQSALRTILSVPGAGNSRYQLLKAMHDYLCERITYSDADGKLAHTAGGVFAGSNRVVCEGYAKAFKVLCDQMEIPCVCVIGYTYNSGDVMHMWNYVRMGDQRWYLVDVTWDDTDRQGDIRGYYFLAGTGTIGGNRIPISSERSEYGYFSNPLRIRFAYPSLNPGAYVWLCSGGHVVVSDPAVAATCTQTGKTAGTHCSRCGDAIQKQGIVPKKAHTPVAVSALAATCTQSGYTAGTKCAVCGSMLSGHEVIPASGHIWGKWTVETPPSIQNKGVEKRTCVRDGTHVETRSIEMEKWTIKKTPSGVKAKAKKKKVKVSWKKLKGKNRKYLKKISSIQVQYALNASFNDAGVQTVSKKKTKTTITVPKKGVWYIRVRYKGSGGVSKWSKVKKVRVK